MLEKLKIYDRWIGAEKSPAKINPHKKRFSQTHTHTHNYIGITDDVVAVDSNCWSAGEI